MAITHKIHTTGGGIIFRISPNCPRISVEGNSINEINIYEYSTRNRIFEWSSEWNNNNVELQNGDIIEIKIPFTDNQITTLELEIFVSSTSSFLTFPVELETPYDLAGWYYVDFLNT